MLDAIGLSVGTVALLPAVLQLLEGGINFWKFFDRSRISSAMKQYHRIRLENEKVILAQWAKRVGLCCASCHPEPNVLEPASYGGQRGGKIILSCDTCSKVVSRISIKTHGTLLVDHIEPTLRVIGTKFVWTDEIAKRHGFYKSVQLEQSPTAFTIKERPRRRDFFKNWGKSTRSVQQRAKHCVRKAAWVVFDEAKLDRFINEIAGLIAQLKTMTEDMIPSPSKPLMPHVITPWHRVGCRFGSPAHAEHQQSLPATANSQHSLTMSAHLARLPAPEIRSVLEIS